MRVVKFGCSLVVVLGVCGLSSVAYAEYADQIYSQGTNDSETNAEVLNNQMQQMKYNGEEVGGPNQVYMDETNDTLLRDQPTAQQIINTERAEDQIQQQEYINQQYPVSGQPGERPYQQYQNAPNRPVDTQQQIRVNGGAGYRR